MASSAYTTERLARCPAFRGTRKLIWGLGLPCAVVLVATAVAAVMNSEAHRPPFFVYLFGVMYATWTTGWRGGLLALVLSLSVLATFFLEPRYSLEVGPRDAVWLAAFGALGSATIYLDAARRTAEEARRGALRELAGAVARAERLGRLLPACACCKRVVDDPVFWADLEAYSVQKAHRDGWVCPSCTTEMYPERGGHVG